MAKNSVTEQITNSLRWEITNGAYLEVTTLTEVEISEKYGVSKTPAREALGILCSEGLLEKIPRKGYLIKRFSMADLASLFQFRSILEVQGLEISKHLVTKEDVQKLKEFCVACDAIPAEEAAARYVDLNRQFHVMLISLARNPFMTAALANTMDRLKLALTADQAIGAPKLSDHEDIIEAIACGDYDRAKQMLSYVNDKVYNRLSVNGDQFSNLMR